jgi:type IV pilus assembly protein PilV
MHRRQLIEQKRQTAIGGFALIEVLVVMTIFSIGILAVAAMQITSTKGNASDRRMTEATALAEKQMENLMQLPYDHADLDPANNPHASSQGPYILNWNISEIDLDSNGTNDSKKVDVAVSWRHAGNRNISIQHIMPQY